jgi:hypothetical protein
LLSSSPVEKITEPQASKISRETDENTFEQKQINIQTPSVFSPTTSSSVEVHSLIDEQKPFFTSKLTNSQLSEEISNEIGL